MLFKGCLTGTIFSREAMSQKHVLSQRRVKVSYSSFRLCNKSGCLELHKPGNSMVNVLLVLHMVEVFHKTFPTSCFETFQVLFNVRYYFDSLNHLLLWWTNSSPY